VGVEVPAHIFEVLIDPFKRLVHQRPRRIARGHRGSPFTGFSLSPVAFEFRTGSIFVVGVGMDIYANGLAISVYP